MTQPEHCVRYVSKACEHELQDKCKRTCKYCGRPCDCTDCAHPDPNAPGPDGTPPAFKLQHEVYEAEQILRRALLAQADHEILRVDKALRDAGIDYIEGMRFMLEFAKERAGYDE